MTRIIKTSTPGKVRATLSKAIVITIREFMRSQDPNHDTEDMVAFIILALREITAGIDASVAAWEKRDYWVKADQYRMAWRWTKPLSDELADRFEKRDWSQIADTLMTVMTHFSDMKVSDRHRMGKPWVGALQEYQQR